MLNHSFLHIPTVGIRTENQIWNSGITSLDDFIKSPPGIFTGSRLNLMLKHASIGREKIEARDTGYFYRTLPPQEHWRLFGEHRHKTAYLDIETTGLSFPGNIITAIALYDGANINCYVNGRNLDDFKDDIRQYDVIVTYNGKAFDIPFIEKYFGIKIPQPHIDLRYILSSLGYKGGLKSCEKQMGIGRDGTLAEVDGFFAVLLWNDYKKTGSEKSLETLLSYNIEDTVNLEYLMIKAYNGKLNQIPLNLKNLLIPDPKPPCSTFQIDAATVNRIKSEYYRW